MAGSWQDKSERIKVASANYQASKSTNKSRLAMLPLLLLRNKDPPVATDQETVLRPTAFCLFDLPFFQLPVPMMTNVAPVEGSIPEHTC